MNTINEQKQALLDEWERVGNAERMDAAYKSVQDTIRGLRHTNNPHENTEIINVLRQAENMLLTRRIEALQDIQRHFVLTAGE